MPVTVLDHPLAGHLLSHLRDRETPPDRFRRLSRLLTLQLVLEATRTIRTQTEAIRTPLATVEAPVLAQGLAVVPILRAGLGMLEPALELFPDVAVGYLGLERDHETAVAHFYYRKLPTLAGRLTLCLDPMLATGGSAAQALTELKNAGAEDLAMVSVIAAPEGIARLSAEHPDVRIVTSAIDERLNDLKYIVPGLGDFGDRLFGTL